QTRRFPLLWTQCFTVLADRDQRFIPRLLDGDAPGHHRRVLSFGEEPLGAGLDADFAEQQRERYPAPLAGAGEAIDELRRKVRADAPVARGPVPGALEEVQSRHGGKALQGVEVENLWTLDHPVDEQFVALRIDGRHAGMVALEVQIRGGHDPDQVLQRRKRASLAAPDRDAPRSLEGRALAQLA